MTALKEYERLESEGLWRADAEAQRREVLVSFGDATLVIADPAGRPLTHWSLAAVERSNPGTRPALFTPDTDTDESLEVADPLMIDAIEKVRKTVDRARPRAGKLRGVVTLGLAAALVALAVFWLPGALRQQTLSVVPQSKRVEIGTRIMAELNSVANGRACSNQRVAEELTRLKTRLFGPYAPGQIVAFTLGQPAALPLPGDILLMDPILMNGQDDPAVAAGYLVAADALRGDRDPLEALLAQAGFANTLRLLTTSELPDAAYTDYARTLVGDTSANLPPQAELRNAFAAAEIPFAPYARYRTAVGQPIPGWDPEAAVEDPDRPEILPDDTWVRLQGICDV